MIIKNKVFSYILPRSFMLSVLKYYIHLFIFLIVRMSHLAKLLKFTYNLCWVVLHQLDTI